MNRGVLRGAGALFICRWRSQARKEFGVKAVVRETHRRLSVVQQALGSLE
jgi:hypothetical protein